MRPFLTLHHPAASKAYYDAGLWRHDTFYSLLRDNAHNFGDRTALIDADRKLTWRQLQEWVDGIAADLRTFGLVSGDRVSSWLSCRAENVALLFACSREGFVYNPSLHRSHTCAKVASLLRGLAPRALVVEDGWGVDRNDVNLDLLLGSVPSLKVVYDVERLPAAAPNLTRCHNDPDTVSYIASTSTPSGEPKFVMHSDNTILSNARELARDWHLNDRAVIMSLSPMSHHIGWVAVAQWLITGCTFVLNDRRAGTTTLDWIRQNGVTYLVGVPTHAIDLLADCRRQASNFGKVDTFYMVSAPTPPSICRELLDLGIRPQNVYGMIENSSHHYTLPHDTHDVLTTTCGRGGRCYEVGIFDPSDSNRRLGANQVGQIGGRGASLMLGYYGDHAMTEESFNDEGWFMSGDMGMMDTDGNLVFVGRMNDVIVRGGHVIYPSAIEHVSIQHPSVEQAACFPLPDDRLGERACLAVKGEISAKCLLEYLRRSGISRFDLPELVVHLSSFPATISGKMLKQSLIERIRRGEISPVSMTGVDVARQASGTPAHHAAM